MNSGSIKSSTPLSKTWKKLIVGDNLRSHFTPNVIPQLDLQNEVYFTCLPVNSTHFMQPLDVAVFKPLKSIPKYPKRNLQDRTILTEKSARTKKNEEDEDDSKEEVK